MYVPFWALTTLANAHAHLGTTPGGADDAPVSELVVANSRRIENYCARKLKSRAYAPASSAAVSGVAVSTTTNRITKAATDFSPYLNAVASSLGFLPANAIVVAEGTGSPSYADLSRNPIASGTTTVTFAVPDTRLIQSGRGGGRLMTLEYPLSTLASASYFDAMGVETPIDLTGAIINRQSGIIMILNDVFLCGSYNLRIACTAGYQDGIDQGDLQDLERIALDLITIDWQERVNRPGRQTSTRSRDGGTITLPDTWMPQRIAYRLSPYVRKEWF